MTARMKSPVAGQTRRSGSWSMLSMPQSRRLAVVTSPKLGESSVHGVTRLRRVIRGERWVTRDQGRRDDTAPSSSCPHPAVSAGRNADRNRGNNWSPSRPEGSRVLCEERWTESRTAPTKAEREWSGAGGNDCRVTAGRYTHGWSIRGWDPKS